MVKLAGAIKEKYNGVEVEVISKGFFTIGAGGDTPKPPNVVVNDKVLGGRITRDELEGHIKELGLTLMSKQE
ncbi:MAG: hypothetical protein WA118_10615 [Carboxydocellales bacterium]